jgi:DNA-binding HxlR family transcriptional regulator
MTTHTLIDKPDALIQAEKTIAANPAVERVENLCNADHGQCDLAIHDAMNVLGGKWRIQILGVLSWGGKQRFTQLLKAVNGIGAKMLSKELQDLEANQIITRTVKQTKPITVEYEMTEYGLSLNKVILEIVNWGIAHRHHIMKEGK